MSAFVRVTAAERTGDIVRKSLKNQAEEQVRFSRRVSDASAAYLERESWTPIMGAMLLSGIQPSSHWTDIPALAEHQDDEPVSFLELFRSLRRSMKKAERGLDGTDVYRHMERFQNAEEILFLWDAYCKHHHNYPVDIVPRTFALGILSLAREAQIHLSEPKWIRVFADHFRLKNQDEFVPRAVLALQEVLPEERRLIPKHKFGKYIVGIWVETGRGIDPDVILARLAKMIKDGEIPGTELAAKYEYSHRSDLRYKQAADRNPRVLRRDTLARQLRRMKERESVTSPDQQAPSKQTAHIPFINTVPVELDDFKRFSQPEQLTELARRLLLEAVHYVRYATLLCPTGGWDRDHAVVVGNIVRLSRLLTSIADQARNRLLDMVIIIGCLAIESMIDIRYLCENFDPDLVDDYVKKSSANGSADGSWGGGDWRQRADAVGLSKTDFFNLAEAPLHIHGTWQILDYLHLNKTEDGKYLPDIEGNTTHPQALLLLGRLSLETTQCFLRNIELGDKGKNLLGAIEDLHKRLMEADELSSTWLARW
ncbi:hypothetical protein [Burkholderia pseudomallei]|uniref:hypothetical protein n=1 Tax=Burkholderia pseudomallei TaxID=28450 RepID=UPI00059CEAAA|nr:hypothetical protein [Burkholderia pseudomallei]ONC53199.1 hypothetical protein AQ918_11730 [Burkholderia pseudomallei]